MHLYLSFTDLVGLIKYMYIVHRAYVCIEKCLLYRRDVCLWY